MVQNEQFDFISGGTHDGMEGFPFVLVVKDRGLDVLPGGRIGRLHDRTTVTHQLQRNIRGGLKHRIPNIL